MNPSLNYAASLRPGKSLAPDYVPIINEPLVLNDNTPRSGTHARVVAIYPNGGRPTVDALPHGAEGLEDVALLERIPVDAFRLPLANETPRAVINIPAHIPVDRDPNHSGFEVGDAVLCNFFANRYMNQGRTVPGTVIRVCEKSIVVASPDFPQPRRYVKGSPCVRRAT